MQSEILEGYRLSAQQEHLWWLQHKADGAAYRAQCLIGIDGNLDKEILRQALEQVIKRHEILRTTFHLLPGMKTPLQSIAEVGIDWSEQYDISQLSCEEQTARLDSIFNDQGLQGYDLQDGPLMRASLIKLADDNHKLLLALPSLCADAATLHNLASEICNSYGSIINGQTIEDEPIQYIVFSEWQNELMDSDQAEVGKDYWRKLNLSSLAEMRLPLESSNAGSEEFGVKVATKTIPLADTRRLEEMAASNGASLSEFLLACWVTLLWHHIKKPDFIIAASSDGRTDEELQGSLGLYAKYLPLNSQLTAESKFSDVVRNIRESFDKANEWHECFDTALLQMPASKDGKYAFLPYIFDYSDVTQERRAAELVFSIEKQYVCIDRFKLRLSCIKSLRGLSAEFHFDLSLFNPDDIYRFASRFHKLLLAVINNPDLLIGKFDILPDDERHLLINGFNQTSRDYSTDTCIHHLFEQQVARTPHLLAVCFRQDHLTYQQLDEKANQLARHLISLSVGPESLVAICMHRSLELVTALLAILKAGAAYLPLDPAYPPARLSYMVEDSAVKLIVTDRGLANAEQYSGVTVVDVTAEQEQISRQSVEGVVSGVTADNLAYVIYTSGSTGKPKGVMISHRAIANRLLWMQQTYPIGPADSLLQKTSMSFDASVWEIFLPLMSGARLVMAEPGGQQDSRYLVETIRREGITILQMVPTMLEVMAAEADIGECRSLRRVYSGGEALKQEVWRKIKEATGAEVVNLYGPTECAIDATSWEVREGVESRIAPIGKPIGKAKVYILDVEQRVAPVGVVGEIYIGGEGVGRGYMRRGDLTAERYIPDEYSGKAGARMYRTGDLGRQTGGGEIEYEGRADKQVKVRGYRIELREIEAEMEEMEEVKRAVVVVREGEGGQRRLVGYVEKKEGRKVREEEMRRRLEERMPEWMVPWRIVEVEEMPVQPNGKVDRRKLEERRVEEERRGEEEVRRGRNIVEEALVEVWKEVLGVEQVSIDDNFLLLGGHSLLAISLISRVRNVFQVELLLQSVFESPKLSDLAQIISNLIREGQGLTIPPIVPTPRNGELPMSFAQQRIWFLHQMDPDNAAYNLPIGLGIEGPLDIPALEKAFKELVARHEPLRTTFSDVEGRAVQVIGEVPHQVLSFIDLCSLDQPSRRSHLDRIIYDNAHFRFDLAAGPLFIATLVALSHQQFALLLCMHHIISDGWSMRLLVREMSALYEAFSTGKPAAGQRLPVQYADYAVWQREWMSGEALDQELSYWKKELESAPVAIDLPTDHVRPATQSYRGGAVAGQIKPEVSEAIRKLSLREGATVFVTMLSAYMVLLSKWSGQEEVVVGTPIAGRNREEIEGVIGMFVNTLAIRGRLGGDVRFDELMRRVREAALRAYAHQEVPFEKVVEEMRVERDMSRSPVFQVMFAMENIGRERVEIEGLKVSGIGGGNEGAKFELTMYVEEEEGGGLSVRMEYNRDMYEEGTVRRMLKQYEKVIEEVVRDSGKRLRDIEVVEEEEKQKLLFDWNSNEKDYDYQRCYHELFEEQVKRTPNAVAVKCGNDQLTYLELNARADKLARLLAERGAGPEVVIALLFERGIDLLTSILAAFKAGSAYLPLDTHHPVNRLKQVIDQSGAPLVLTTAAFEQVSGQVQANLNGSRRAQVFMIEELMTMQAREQTLPMRSRPENLAYVIYTSGSTGLPKGAMIEQGGMVNHLWSKIDDLKLTGSDVVAQTASQCFDISIWQFLSPLMIGGCVRIVADEIAHDAGRLMEEMEAAGVTIAEAVPSMLRAVLEDATQKEKRQVKKLRWMVSTGEALDPETCRRWKSVYPEVELMNVYGPTECSDDVTSYTVVEAPRDDETVVPIGRPVGNLKAYILDENLKLVSVGIKGDIYAGGIGIGRGYLNDPERTAQAFIPDPFSTAPGARLYKTGDTGRHKADGNLECLGRKDYQVKVRGFRIELAEIETILSKKEEVQQAVVVVMPDKMGANQLVAYFVEREGSAIEADDLRSYLRAKLPEYMIPSIWVKLDAIPLNSNGKVDRRALPPPDEAALRSHKEFVAPRTQIEVEMAELWKEMLDVNQVGVYDNFFELGGHSLLLTQLVSRIRRIFGVEMSLRSLFEAPTVEEMTKVILSKQMEHANPDDLSGMLEELKQLSPDEIRSMLEAEA